MQMLSVTLVTWKMEMNESSSANKRIPQSCVPCTGVRYEFAFNILHTPNIVL